MEEEQTNQRRTVLLAIVAAIIVAVVLWFVIFSNSTSDEEAITPDPTETPITENNEEADITTSNPFLAEDNLPLPADIAGAQATPVAEDVAPTTPTGAGEIIIALSMAALVGGLFALKQLIPVRPRS